MCCVAMERGRSGGVVVMGGGGTQALSFDQLEPRVAGFALVQIFLRAAIGLADNGAILTGASWRCGRGSGRAIRLIAIVLDGLEHGLGEGAMHTWVCA